MKDFIFLSLICLSTFFANAQGLENGLNYKHDYNQDIQNAQKNEQLDNEARAANERRQAESAKAAKEKVQICINQIKSWYTSLKQYPEVSDGWHQVYATDNNMMCDVKKVYVENGKVTRYSRLDGIELKVIMRGTVSKAKAFISIMGSDNITYMMDLYFNE